MNTAVAEQAGVPIVCVGGLEFAADEGTVTHEQDGYWADVEIPDDDWVSVDAAGHEHRWTRFGTVAGAAKVEVHVTPCCECCGGYTETRWVCSRGCSEEIFPGYLADKEWVETHRSWTHDFTIYAPDLAAAHALDEQLSQPMTWEHDGTTTVGRYGGHLSGWVTELRRGERPVIQATVRMHVESMRVAAR